MLTKTSIAGRESLAVACAGIECRPVRAQTVDFPPFQGEYYAAEGRSDRVVDADLDSRGEVANPTIQVYRYAGGEL